MIPKTKDLIILHGWNLNGAKFAGLADVFRRQGYRVFTPDFPGFGLQPPPSRPWHVVDYAEFLRQYIQKNQMKDPIIIGHSFGGRVTLKYVQLYPKSARAIVLSGTPGFSPIPKKKMFLFLVIAKIGGMLFSIPPLSLFSGWARRWLYYLAGTREFIRAEGVMKDTFKNIVRDDLSSAMTTVTIPCLLLWGEYDVIVPEAIARRMCDVIPTATLKVIPEVDHGVPFKEPDVFAGFVKEFLNTRT